MDRIINFIKYNNAAIIILAIVFVLGGAAFAAGPETIGEKQTSVQGLDNTALLALDLKNFNMDFKIENIKQDEKYYYATYSYLDLVVLDQAWQYQLNSRTREISQKIKEDLGEYLAKFLVKHYEARLRELKRAQAEAANTGVEKRVEVTEYSGLIGRTLDLAAKVFPGYESVKKRELPAPEFNPPAPLLKGGEGGLTQGADNLTRIYNDYLAAHPEIFMVATSSLLADASSTPPVSASSLQADLTAPASVDTIMASSSPDSAPADAVITETPAIPEPESVNVIELPAPADEAVPVAEATPTQ